MRKLLPMERLVWLVTEGFQQHDELMGAWKCADERQRYFIRDFPRRALACKTMALICSDDLDMRVEQEMNGEIEEE